MFDHIDHVGVAVEDLDKTLDLYCNVFGMTLSHDETVEEQGTRALFLSAPSGPDIELLIPLGPDTPVGKFLAKRGAGMHHICYAVENLEDAMKKCRKAGLQIVDEVPRIGAKGKRLVFLHPKSAAGVLIELCDSHHQQT